MDIASCRADLKTSQKNRSEVELIAILICEFKVTIKLL